jgi:hypothetical protein
MVLAHQGGWDEMLMVIGPILVIVLLLRLAKKRAERAATGRADEPDDGAAAHDGAAADEGADTPRDREIP